VFLRGQSTAEGKEECRFSDVSGASEMSVPTHMISLSTSAGLADKLDDTGYLESQDNKPTDMRRCINLLNHQVFVRDSGQTLIPRIVSPYSLVRRYNILE
jgi:hypothetical protein